MKQYLETHRKVVGLIAAGVALSIAILYLYVTPQEALEATGIQRAIIAYGHSLCWMLLSAASFLWAMQKNAKLSVLLVYLAAATYGSFILAAIL